jgi:hypothetical protein
MDPVGFRVLTSIASVFFGILAFLMLNGLIPIHFTGNGLYDSIIVFMVGILIWIIGQIWSNKK